MNARATLAFEHMFGYSRGMTGGALDQVEGLLTEALTALRVATGPGIRTEELVRAVRLSTTVEREAQRVSVGVVAAMQRDGVFAASRQRPASALADLLCVEYVEARRLIIAADHVTPRVDLQGQPLPPRLPATADAFDAGAAGLRHIEVIAGLMATPAAGRLHPDTWAAAEEQIAAVAADHTPGQLHRWGTDLLSLLDQDGEEPDERDPEPINELILSRNPIGSGGKLKGRFDDAAMYELIASVLDARSAPLTAHDQRPPSRRRAEAMAAVFGYVADHGDSEVAPAAGGRRPHISVLVRLEELETRARAACLDLGGVATPATLRMLCCDACVIPVVLGGAGQPLDVGRATRTIPDGLRRAVIARDRGCAHPGCDRPPSWCEVHHVVPWELGGETKLTNLVMLCRTHHREIHLSGWNVRIDPAGIPEFRPPTWIDPLQRPHRRTHVPSPTPPKPPTQPSQPPGPTEPTPPPPNRQPRNERPPRCGTRAPTPRGPSTPPPGDRTRRTRSTPRQAPAP